MATIRAMERSLKSEGIRVKVDDTEGKSAGWKFNFWEMKVCLVTPICFELAAYSMLRKDVVSAFDR